MGYILIFMNIKRHKGIRNKAMRKSVLCPIPFYALPKTRKQ